MTTSAHQQAIHLVEQMSQAFSLREFRSLCFRLGLDPERFATEEDLVAHYQRRNDLAALIVECEHLRPQINWRTAAYSVETVASNAVSTTSIASSAEHYPIFLSYAALNDQPLFQEQLGWVTHFVEILSALLDQRAGQQNAYPIWWQALLGGNLILGEEVQSKIQAAQFIIVLLSNAYLQNAQCRTELDLFMQTHPINSGRIFVIELDNVYRPDSLQNVVGYQFWQWDKYKKNTQRLAQLHNGVEDAEYMQRIQALANDIVRALHSQQHT